MRPNTCTHIVKATIEKMRVTTRDSGMKPAPLLAISCHAEFFRARDSGFLLGVLKSHHHEVIKYVLQ
jgi:hypothetical protein